MDHREVTRRRIQRILDRDEVVLNWETAGRLMEIYHSKYAGKQEAVSLEIRDKIYLTKYEHSDSYGFIPVHKIWKTVECASVLAAYSLALEKLGYSIKR